MPAAALWLIGLVLIAWAAALWTVAGRRPVPERAGWTIVALNLIWVVDSVLLVLAGWFPLTGVGTAVVLAQAAGVAVFADLQFTGLRRVRSA